MTEIYNETDYGYIDIESCFYPILEPPLDFINECKRRWREKQSILYKNVERKISNTWYLIETKCAGKEYLADKAKRLIFSDKGTVRL